MSGGTTAAIDGTGRDYSREEVLQLIGVDLLARRMGFDAPSAAAPVKSIEELAREREDKSRQVLRGYSLTVMLRKQGIRRSIPRGCTWPRPEGICGKTISANKKYCREHAV